MTLEPDLLALAEHRGRGPGTDAERRAANHLRARLEQLGRDAHLEPTVVRPEWTQVLIVHALLAVGASLASVVVPTAATIVAFLVLSSVLAYLTGLSAIGAVFSPRRASQNVMSTERGNKPGTLVLLAHYDSSRDGSTLGRTIELLELVARPLRVGPGALLMLALLAVFVCCGLRTLDLATPLLAAVQFVPTALLLLGAAVLVDGRTADFVPGANDNASGVAVALALGERFGGRLEHFDLAVLLTGAHEGMALGARAWARRHKRGLSKEQTIFLNLDSVGLGRPAFATREGILFPSRANSTLVEQCRAVTVERTDLDARLITRAAPSDAAALRERGYAAVTLTAVDDGGRTPRRHRLSDTADGIDSGALERAEALGATLIERIDRQVGPRLTAGPDPS